MQNKTLRKYPDLIEYRRKNIIIPFIYCIIYYIVIFSVFAYCYYAKHYENHWVFYLIVISLLMVPIVLFKPFSFLFEKDYKGKIIEKKFSGEIADTANFALRYNKYKYEKEVAKHTILTESGDRIEYNISNDNYDNSSKEMGRGFVFPVINSPLRDYYNVDDEIEHFAGFFYNRKTNLKHDEKNICIVCGTLNMQKDDCCINCGHSIVK